MNKTIIIHSACFCICCDCA